MAREAITCKEPQAKKNLRTPNHSHSILDIKQEDEMGQESKWKCWKCTMCDDLL